MTINIGCIVEGHGEVEAVPLLVRRISQELLGYNDSLNIQTVRVHKAKIVKTTNAGVSFDEQEIRRSAELAARKICQCGGLITLLDADDDLACVVGPLLLEKLEAMHSHLTLSVVFPIKEFEAWFIGAAQSLAGYRGVREDVTAPRHVEEIRDAKGWLSSRMDHVYSPSVDQAKFASRIDLQQARSVPSFDKLCRDLERMLMALTGAPP